MLQRITSLAVGATAGTLPVSRGGSTLHNSSISRRRGSVNKLQKRTYFTTAIILSVVALVSVVFTATLIIVVLWSSPTSVTTTSSDPARTKLIAGVDNLLHGKIKLKNSGADKEEESKQRERHFFRKPHQDVAVSGGDGPIETGQSEKDHFNSNARALHLDAQNEATKPNVVGGGRVEYPYPLDMVDESYDIATNFVVLGGSRYSEYMGGDAPYTVSAKTRQKADAVARTRRLHVKNAMQFVWEGYVKYAFGMDDFLPQSGRGVDSDVGGKATTMVDALDTLWLMNMKDEFWQARDWIRDHLDHSKVGSTSLFETTIRDLGGLLAAHDWSGDHIFLEKAVGLSERLLQAFEGSPTGIPFGQVSLKDGRPHNDGWLGDNAMLSEFGSIQLEFRYLANHTGRPELAQKTDHIFEIMHEISPENGLFPNFYCNNPRNHGTATFAANSHITFGARSDSFYEYMLKLWLQSGKTEPVYREMYDKAMDGMHKELLQKSTPSGLTYIADRNSGMLDKKMDHLVCFMGGLLALGAYTDPRGLESERAVRDLRTAKALTYTCYQMYARMKTGISAEFVQFSDGQDFQIGRGAPHYLLRPEAIESMFILNQLTGDPVYREWGWEIFQAIEKFCKTKYGYGALSNVDNPKGQPQDRMESFFMAETLKYSYLLQDPDTEIDVLRKHVFNTEAHPLRIFST